MKAKIVSNQISGLRNFTSRSFAANVIDLRSDSVSHPSEKMREAIRTAEVGDDGRRKKGGIYGDCPTTNLL